MFLGERSSAVNEPTGVTRFVAALGAAVVSVGSNVIGPASGACAKGSGGAIITGAEAASITTGSGGVVVRGGNGWTKLRRTLGGRCGSVVDVGA